MFLALPTTKAYTTAARSRRARRQAEDRHHQEDHSALCSLQRDSSTRGTTQSQSYTRHQIQRQSSGRRLLPTRTAIPTICGRVVSIQTSRTHRRRKHNGHHPSFLPLLVTLLWANAVVHVRPGRRLGRVISGHCPRQVGHRTRIRRIRHRTNRRTHQDRNGRKTH